jgi:hypothetical protein
VVAVVAARPQWQCIAAGAAPTSTLQHTVSQAHFGGCISHHGGLVTAADVCDFRAARGSVTLCGGKLIHTETGNALAGTSTTAERSPAPAGNAAAFRLVTTKVVLTDWGSTQSESVQPTLVLSSGPLPEPAASWDMRVSIVCIAVAR